jgi:hypothetical protein
LGILDDLDWIKVQEQFHACVHDRISKHYRMPGLDTVIAARAKELNLGASWAGPCSALRVDRAGELAATTARPPTEAASQYGASKGPARSIRPLL